MFAGSKSKVLYLCPKHQNHMPSTWSSSWLPTKKLQNVFWVKQQIATICFVFFFIFMLSHVIQTKSNYKMVSQPNHINPHTAFKKLLCYKMSCLGTFLKPCFADKVDYIVRPGPLAVCSWNFKADWYDINLWHFFCAGFGSGSRSLPVVICIDFFRCLGHQGQGVDSRPGCNKRHFQGKYPLVN